MIEVRSTAKKLTGPAHTASHEEIQAAMLGKLQARNIRGNRQQTKLVQKGRSGVPAGRPLGTSTGLPVYLAIVFTLQQNEKAPKNRKLTDQKLAEWMRSEFPGRDTKFWDGIQNMRTNYNIGKYTKGMIPKLQSHRYDSGGECIDPKYKRRKTSKH